MFITKTNNDYDKIMLSFKERRILRRIMKKEKVPYSFCSDHQRDVFLKYELITIWSPKIVTSAGRVVSESSVLPEIHITDKAKRYFLYRKEDYFKGKIPVIIALIALIKSFDVEICRLVNFISNWLSSLLAAKSLP